MARHKRKPPLHNKSRDLDRPRRSDAQKHIKTKDVMLGQDYFLPSPDVPFLETLLDKALSVQEGKFADLKGLVRSMHGRLPQASDNFSIPAQRALPRRIISADTAIYKAMTARASDLMSGRLPPDRTEPWFWNNTIGPRIANVLLRMAKRSRPSALEISAYLHMALNEFFIDGHRSPTVAIEKSFGDFLMEDARGDVEWDNSVIKGNPRFLILRRGEELKADYHWYVIIVDINAKRAYCLDSKVDRYSKANHIEAFSSLKKAWAARLPQIPAPNKMIELRSFTQNNDYMSGFLCLYHIMLFFRRPHGLLKLKHGNITMSREYFDDIIKPAEKYIGIKVTESRNEGAPSSCLN